MNGLDYKRGLDKPRTVLPLIVLAALCTIGLLTSTSAHATVYRVDRFSITKPNFDLGDGTLNNISGRPNDDARLDWNRTAAGNWEPRLIGRNYINNASGDCVRIQFIVWFTTTAATYTDNSSDFCAPNGQTWRNEVDFAPVSSPDVILVQVVLQSASSANGPWVTEGASLPFVRP